MTSIDRSGACVCGVATALHFDQDNRMVGCDEARRRLSESLKPVDPPPQEAPRDLHVVHPASEREPESFTKGQLAERLQIGLRTFDRLRHQHPAIKQLDGPGHPRFCVKTYERWRDGGSSAPAARSFFGRARKHA
jgi:hypothetical protein